MRGIKIKLVAWTNWGSECCHQTFDSKKAAVEQGRWLVDNGYAFSYKTFPIK